jgi:Sulfite oxidase and related enzymes
MIIREKEPVNLEMPFETLDGFITPNDRFYVRCHFPIPAIDPSRWKLRIEGAVEKPMELRYDELSALEPRHLTVTLECAGNGRVFLVPKVKGVQWELGAVGNAEWTGVPLSDLLQHAAVKSSAREVIFEGADNGPVSAAPHPAGKIHFARSVPIEKAAKDVLLAYKMNGEVLPPSHGFPLRAIVPGWYGMASIKWLQRIIVTDNPFHGYYQTIDYAHWEQHNGGPSLLPLTRMVVKAQISRPAMNEVVRSNDNYLIKGAAWTSNAEITKVEVSTDGGKQWSEAELLGKAVANAWRLWHFNWKTPSRPGQYKLLARATDSTGAVQPHDRAPNRGTYVIDHALPIDIEVR